jgi:hypothetical protein
MRKQTVNVPGKGPELRMIVQRRLLGFAALGIAVLSLAACASTGASVNSTADAGDQLAPVNSGNVQTAALPPIGPNGEVQGPNDQIIPPTTNPDGTQIAAADSMATLPPVGALPNSAGRDLTGGLTPEKLLGRWTMVSGQDQCSVNLTQTAKAGTSRYRASAPGCTVDPVSKVASWQLNASTVNFYDEGGTMIAALILSGNRFIGTMSGGRGVQMNG